MHQTGVGQCGFINQNTLFSESWGLIFLKVNRIIGHKLLLMPAANKLLLQISDKPFEFF